jgi:hypothetical protein
VYGAPSAVRLQVLPQVLPPVLVQGLEQGLEQEPLVPVLPVLPVLERLLPVPQDGKAPTSEAYPLFSAQRPEPFRPVLKPLA